MPFAPASHFYNGLNQRVLRENPQGQTVYVYGSEGHNVLGEYQPPGTSSIRWSNGLSTEHVWLPTASGPMPVAAVINGEHFAVHADHLNTPRRLTDRNGNPRWQWAYSGFGEVGPQSLTTATLPEVRLNLRYPGQVDDANGLFYNWHRFYQPQTGRYTKADPIGLDGGWNRFAYVGGNALGAVDPLGLDTAVIVGGATGGNPFGHAAIAFTAQGVYSYGTGTPLGGNLTDYLASQATYRDSTVYVIKTTPEQEAMMREKVLKYRGTPLPDPRKDPWGAANDTCATRTQNSLAAGGVTSALAPYTSPFPTYTGALAARNASTTISIPRGGEIPSHLSSFNR
jgi:RHS repeat-associated protein